MITYSFKCIKCGKEFDKFRYGLENLKKWKEGKLKINCPICRSKEVEYIEIPKGSGKFIEVKI